MAVIKNNKTGMWEVRTYYKDLTGARKQKTKRGFAKKSEALEWERNFKLKEDQSISMSFKSFVDIYLTDLEPRIKRNTFLTKKHIIETKILPYFGKRKLDDIRTSDVIQWQNEIMKLKKDNGELFSSTYLKTIHNQLSALLNYAVNVYKHLSVLDYKKQERAKEVAALEEELEGAQVVLELKEERIESLEKEIESKRDGFRKEQSEAQKKLDDTIAENQKLQLETTDLRLKNSELRLEYYENVDKLTDKQKEIEVAQKEADKWMMISDTAKLQTERAEFELEEAERLKKELLGVVDGDDYLKEQVIELRYQNQVLREENSSLKEKLEKAYEFMKQFVIGGINLLEKFMEWIGEKVKDVGRGR